MECVIYKSTGSWYEARGEDGKKILARLAGKMKLDEEISSSNPVAVGDRVEIRMEPDSEDAVITRIFPRENYMVRAFNFRGAHRHILASNIDQALLVASLRAPVTSFGFVDRFLVTAAAYHIPVILLFNKKDLYKEKEWSRLKDIKKIYEGIGYKVLTFNANEDPYSQLEELLVNKRTLVAGHSGVGKSTLMNHLIPGLNQKTQAVSNWSGKGLHTTTFAEMFDLPGGGSLVDTPGVREWGVVDIAEPELSHYFLEMQPYVTACKFNNCLHTDEPDCAVQKAVMEGNISVSRFESYLSILASIQK